MFVSDIFEKELKLQDQIAEKQLKNYLNAQRFYFLAEQCLNLIQKSMQPVLKEFKLNHSQHLVLLTLRYADFSGNAIKNTDLAYLLGLEKHTVSTIIDNLYKRGLLSRDRNEKDRRTVNIKLTEKGRILVKTHHPKTMEKISFETEGAEEDFELLFSVLESLRNTSAEKNNQSPMVYSSAFKKLLLDGQEKFLKKYNREAFDA